MAYRPDEPQGSWKDFEFSRPTMELRWQQGLGDARTTLQASPWLAPMPSELGVRVFDVIHDILTRNATLAERSVLGKVPTHALSGHESRGPTHSSTGLPPT